MSSVSPINMIKDLVAAGGQQLPLLTSQDGGSCLHSAAFKGQVEVVKALVAAGGQELLMLTSHDCRSCLHNASIQGQVEVVKEIVAPGGQELLILKSDKGCACAGLLRSKDVKSLSLIAPWITWLSFRNRPLLQDVWEPRRPTVACTV